MKSAGNVSSNSLVPWRGCPRWAKGIDPESNHVSSTSGIRCITPPHLGHGMVTLSMYGRWRSALSSRPISAAELTHRCLSLCRPHVPRVERVVDERRAAAPALGVRMQDGLGLVEEPAGLEVVLDERVGFLNVKAGELFNIGQKLAVEAHRVPERNALFLAQPKVVDAVER